MAATALAETMDDVSEDFAAGDVADEEDFTSQLIGRWKERVANLKTDGSVWRVKAAVTELEDGPPLPSVRFSPRKTTSHGGGTEEKWCGADLLIVLDIKAKDQEISKGLLVQSKRLERGQQLPTAGAERLRSQCRDMLELSAASYVFVYSREGVTVLSASAVESTTRRDLHELEQWDNSAKIVFADFMKCWIGDPGLKATDRDSLATLRAFCEAKNAVLLQGIEPIIEPSSTEAR